MKSFLLLSLLFSLVQCAYPPKLQEKKSQSKEKAMYYKQIGLTELIKGNYRTALIHLRQAKKQDPLDPIIHNNLGLTYFNMKEYKLSEQSYLEALRLHPIFTEVKNNLGALYITVGKYPEAIPLLKEATQDLTYAKPSQAWQNLGLAYFYSGKFKSSTGAFLKALEFKPQQCRATYYYARSLYERRSYDLAAKSFDRAVNRCQKFDEPIFYGALSYIALKNKTEAAGRLRELVANYPKSEFYERAQKLLKEL